jgi:hypothetical protein
MAAPKAKTLIEQMGFRDDDLTTPQHDAIMIWLDENINQIADATKEFWLPAGVARTAAVNVEERIWERPIRPPNSSFIVGFVDMYVMARTEKGGLRTFAIEVKSRIRSNRGGDSADQNVPRASRRALSGGFTRRSLRKSSDLSTHWFYQDSVTGFDAGGVRFRHSAHQNISSET